MEKHILVLAGAKQSGKNTVANFVTGYILTQLGRMGLQSCPTSFDINDQGQLLVNSFFSNESGKKEEGTGILDLNRTDYQFLLWANQVMWPHVKTFAFADRLKQIAISVFGLTYDQVYGTDDDKNTDTKILWKSMTKFIHPRTAHKVKTDGKYEKFMTAREFLQHFGTDVCRRLYDNCWAETTMEEIVSYPTELAIVTDARFKNELEVAKKYNAKLIHLKRRPFKDSHASENGLKDVPVSWFDLVIKENITLKQMNQQVLDVLYKWGWFTEYIEK